MVNIISDYIPPFSPLPNIAPFTYKDGETYLTTLDNLRTYVNTTLVDFVNSNYAAIGDATTTEINALIGQVNSSLTSMNSDVTTVQSLYDQVVTLTNSASADATAAANSASTAANFSLWVNAVQFGADPTGVAFSDAAVDSAISSSPNRSGAVFFPAGHYKFASPILVGNSTKIVGAGGGMTSQINDIVGGPATMVYNPQTILDFPNDTDGIVTPNSTSYNFRSTGIKISNVTILGSNPNGISSGVRFIKNVLNETTNKIYGKVGLSGTEDVFIEGFGIGWNGDGTSDSCYAIRTHIHNCGQGLIDGDSETQVMRSDFWQLTVGPAITVNGFRGFYGFNEFEPGITADSVKVFGTDNKFIGNDFKDCATGLVFWGSRNNANGNSFSRAIQNSAILVGRSDGSQTANDCIINGNTIEQFGVTSIGGYDAILVYGGANRTVIIGNTFSNPGTFAASNPGTPSNAINIRKNSSGLFLTPSNCIISSNSSTGLISSWADVGTNNQWINNNPISKYDSKARSIRDSVINVQETIDRMDVTSVLIPTTSGNVRLTYFEATATQTINSVKLSTGSTPAAATPTLIRVGIYSVDPITSDLTLVASTPNDTTLFSTALARYTKNLSAPLYIIKGQRYAVGILVVTAAAAPTVSGYNGINFTIYTDIPRLSAGIFGVSDLPISATNSSLSESGQMSYTVLL